MDSLDGLGSVRLLGCIAVFAILLWLPYKIYSRCTEQARYMKLHGCQSIGPSYPGTSFLIGWDFLLENVFNALRYRFTDGVAERFKRYGPTFQSQILLKGIVNTIDPENLEAIFKTHFEDYKLISAREKLMETFYGRGIIGNSGHEWRQSRSLVQPAVVGLSLDSAVFDKHASNLVTCIRLQQPGEFEFRKLASLYMLDVMTEIFFGESTFALLGQNEDNRLGQFTKDFTQIGTMARALTIFNRQFPFLRRIMYWNDYLLTKRRVKQFVDAYIQQALATRQSEQSNKEKVANASRPRGTLVERLASQTSDAEHIRGETLNCMLATRDTMGIVLGELFYLLARHPGVWARLCREASETLARRPPTLSELTKMTYLKYVLNEGKPHYFTTTSKPCRHNERT